MNTLNKEVHNDNLIFLCVPFAVLILAFLFKNTFLNIFLISFANILLAFKFRNFKTKNEDFFKPLNLVSYSFLFFYALQSPIFPADFIFYEALYFFLKLASIFIIIIFLFNIKLKVLGCNLILFVHFFDSIFIRLVNLDLVKSPTEYFSIFEFITLLYFVNLLSFFLLKKNSSLEGTIRGSMLLSFCVFALANYWAAGQAKLMLDGGVFSWLENETFLTASRADFWGLNVINFSFLRDTYLYESIQYLGNFFVFISQVTVGLFVFWPPAVIIYSIFFEFFHIFVGLAAGVWFYKWMWVTSIIILLRKDIINQLRIRNNYIIKMSLFLILLAAPTFMTMEPLAWYELRQGDLIRAFGNKEDKKFRLHQQYFGSAAFPILAKYSYSSFKYGGFYAFHASEIYADKIKAINCEFKKTVNDRFSTVNKARLEEITKRLLENRPYWSQILINIQPFHILIPNLESDYSLMGRSYDSITFDSKIVCFNSRGEKISEQHLDEFIVRKPNYKREGFYPYYIWLQDKLDRMSKKNLFKRPLNFSLNYLKREVDENN